MHGTRTRIVVTLAGLAVMASAACSSSGSDSPKSAPATSNTATQSDGGSVDSASQQLVTAALSANQTYPQAPGTFTPGSKTAGVIAQGFAIPVIQAMAQEAVKAYKAMGWKAEPALDGKLNPATFGGQLDQLVQQKVDAVTFISAPLEPIKASVKRAVDAGVAVTCVNCDIPSDIYALGVRDASVDFVKQGEILAASIITRSKGKANVVITEEPAQATVVDRVKGLKKQFATCSGCQVQSITIPAATSVLPGPPIWTSFLTKNPTGSGITDAVSYYDGLTLTMATALKQQGRSDIAISGFDADEAPVAGLANKSLPVVADLAIPYEYQVWSAVDLAGRMVAKAPLWDASKMPSTLLDSTNAGSYKPYVGPSGDWRAVFEKNWGVSA